MTEPLQPRRRRQLRVAIGLAALALFGPGAYQWARLSLAQRQLDRRLAALSVEHDRLAREQERLQSDPTYVEGLIRTTFKLAQPGELVIPLDSSSKR